MRDRRRILDVGYLVTRSVECANRGFPTGSRTLDHYVQVFQAVFSSRVTGSFSCYLRSKRCALARPAKSRAASGCPRQNISLAVGESHNCVVKGSVYMRYSVNNRLFHLFTGTCTWLCHFFLPVIYGSVFEAPYGCAHSSSSAGHARAGRDGGADRDGSPDPSIA